MLILIIHRLLRFASWLRTDFRDNGVDLHDVNGLRSAAITMKVQHKAFRSLGTHITTVVADTVPRLNSGQSTSTATGKLP